MKNLFNILTVLCLGVTVAWAQSDQDTKTLKTTLKDYLKVVKAKDIEAVLDYMPPQMFEATPRAQIKAALSGENMQKVEYKKMDIKKISPIFTHQKIKYVLINYLAVVTIPTPTKDSEQMEMFLTNMQAALGKDNVSLDKKKGELSVMSVAQMYAILNPAIKGWKFIGRKQGTPLPENIIPEAVVQHFPE